MLSAVLRTQARAGLVRTARTSAPVATRALSALVSRATVVPATTGAGFAIRAFSSSRMVSFDRPERPINPPSDTLFVGNVPWSVTKEEIHEIFSDFGEIKDEIRMPLSFDGRSRGFAHVTYVDQASAVAAMESARQEPLHLNGRDLVLDYAQHRTSSAPPNPPSNKVYFTNFEGGETPLRDLLSDFESDILSVFLLRDGNTGAIQNNGFVEFSTTAVAQSAIDRFNGMELNTGAKLVMNFARPRKERTERTENSRFGDRRSGGGDRRSGGHYSGRGYESRGGGNRGY